MPLYRTHDNERLKRRLSLTTGWWLNSGAARYLRRSPSLFGPPVTCSWHGTGFRRVYGRSHICNLFSLKRHGRLCSHISGFSLLSRHHNEIRQENVLHPFGLKAHAANDLFLLRSYLFCHYCDYTLHFSEPPDSFPSFKTRPSDRRDFPVFTPASQH
ncbi:hypothetical protein Dda3937_04363 [Dickeya dadantii 3937]|uniref:Uncharacterized protein n=1 Tax=Dickeya dadantii (strain 3937) TaxID=198628 RepID=E0SLE9_DICD3|nr:hypothetical protein Dda3937_04363 [Dickeya dadantii 3937]